MRPARPGIELGMELGRQKPRMMLQLDDLDQTTVRRDSAQHEAVLDEPITIGIVQFVAVPMPFVHFELAIGFKGSRALLDRARITSQAHGAALVFDAALIVHEINNGRWALRQEFGAVGVAQAGNISGKFNDRALHPKAKPQERNPLFAGVLDGRNLSLDAPPPEPSGNNNTIHIGPDPVGTALLTVLSVNPLDARARPAMNAAMHNGFGQ